MSRPLSPLERLQIAVESRSDPRSVKRAYAGRPMRSTVHGRIAQAARALKLPAPLPLTDTQK
jgi:hypothetical protein